MMPGEPPTAPRAFDELPEAVRQEIRRRQAIAEADQVAGAARYARRRGRGAIMGAVAALVVAPVLGNQPWYFPFAMAFAGGACALAVVRSECEAFGGALLYGGSLVLLTLVAHVTGIIRMTQGASSVFFLFGWAALVGIGAMIGLLAESDRGLYLP